jgi:two-component system chemotaxis sensor kinase CheA
MDESDDEIIVEFILEAREILDLLDQSFVELEVNPTNSKLIANIFRGLHTLKGSSAVFAFKRLERVAHAGESLLSALREGTLQFDSTKATTLLSAVDVIRDIVFNIDRQRTEPEGDDTVLVENLLALSRGLAITLPQEIEKVSAEVIQDTTNTAAAITNASESEQSPHPLTAESLIDSGEHQELEDLTTPHTDIKINEVAAPIKVNLEVLDKLINVTSEMVLARNRLLPFTNIYSDPAFSAAVRNIDLLTQELQGRMLTTRMEPISQVWLKFPRLIRDISNELGKKVELIQEGAETELDRTLLDTIRDPLIHIIRNSVDHGIELPAVRLAQGKSEVGKIYLRANHENGMVVIEVADDGAGIDFEAVRDKVIEKNLADKSEVITYTDSQLLPFIFLPGFSTKKVVTNLSGRGVGADVVKTNIANIGGSVDVESHRGRGTHTRMKIPLTLAIMPALFVRCQGERYAIPQNNIVEMVNLDAKRSEYSLEDFYGVPVFRLREKLVPLLFLSKQLQLDAALPSANDSLNVAVLQSHGVLFGLVVDEVLNIQEVVIKSIGRGLKSIPDFAGATILGDGRVALILHIDGIATNSGLVAKLQARTLNPEPLIDDRPPVKEIGILLFNLPGLENIAIELSDVERLEKIPVTSIQRSGDRDVVKYGDGIMPLIPLHQYIQGAQPITYDEDKLLPVIVHYVKDKPIGLVVSQVQDIMHVSSVFHRSDPPQRGLNGCVISGDRIINIIDLQEIMMLYTLPETSSTYPQTVDMVTP